MFLYENHCKLFNVSINLPLTELFWKTETSFKRLEYLFLVESTTVDNVTFQYKNGPSKANFKTDTFRNTNEPITENLVLLLS